jgi:hypothetical protein
MNVALQQPQPQPQPQYMMRGIPAHMVEHFWIFAEPYVKRALDHASGEFTPTDFRQSCIERNLQLWLISHNERIVGAITTEIVVYPHRKHCRVITLAGSEFMNWMQVADETLAAWATAQGCDALEAYVRKGFVPKLEPLGYKHRHSVVLKELTR